MTSIEEIADLVVECRLCPRLVDWRERVAAEKRASFRDETYWGRPVPGFGNASARCLLVGLAPAAHGANRTGRMFTGDRSGDFLYGSLFRTGFANQAHSASRDDGLQISCYVTSAVKCAPPENKPLRQEESMCSVWLDREIDAISPRVVIALGAIGFRAVVDAARRKGWAPRPRLKDFGHGAEFHLDGGRVVICSYHPSQQNTFTGRLTERMLDQIFVRARSLLTAGL